MHAEVDTEVLSDLFSSFEFDDGKLPSLPNAVIYLERAMQDDTVSLTKLADLLSMDPVLAARLVRVSNSAYFRAISPVETVPEAVTRIGFTATRNIALVLLQNSFKAQNEVVASMISELWFQSVSVAAVATVLAKHYKLVDSNRAMLGGLMYNVGAMLLLSNIDEKVRDANTPIIVSKIVEDHAPAFGVKLLQHWEMDPELVEVVANRDNWQREYNQIPDLADLVLVARSCISDVDGTPPDFDYCETLPSYRRIRKYLNRHEPLCEVVEAAQESIQQTLDILN